MVSRVPLPRQSLSVAGSSPASSLKKSATNPSKPLLKKSASAISGTKRSHDDAELDPPSSPATKRQKHVEFNPKDDVQVFEPYTKDLESVRLEVRQAIDEHLKSDGKEASEAYDTIKGIFSTTPEKFDAPNPKTISTYLQALTACVTSLNNKCNGLVRSVLGMQWLGRDERFVKQYVSFLGNLVSAQGSYVPVVLEACVGKFLKISPSAGRLEAYPLVNKQDLNARLHMALKYLLRVIPSASSTLSSILSVNFPYSNESKRVHIEYIGNLTKIMEYAPELKSEIYAVITDRLVKIDVQMQVDLDDVNETETEDLVNDISLSAAKTDEGQEEDDVGDDDSDNDSVNSDDDDLDDLTEAAKRVRDITQNAEKMDSILDILFELYTPAFEDPESPNALNTFKDLLAHFTNIILPTYRSRHTQFLLFHFAQKTEYFIDAFAGTCAELAFDLNRPAVLRQSAAAYLASFVARGAHVPDYTVQTVFGVIGTHLDQIRKDNEITCRGPDLSRYSTFYATTQALLYIFCFRWRELIVSDFDEEEELKSQDLIWVAGIKELLYRTIYSKLNPLKVCAPAIVEEFAKITQHLGFLYVYPLLESNKRLRLSQFVLTGSGNAGQANYSRDAGYSSQGENWYQLDAYFPFDPYQLPISKKWVEADYLVWKKIPGLQDDEESDEEGDEDDDDDGEVPEEDEETEDE